jgi:hypothetical protein
MAANHIQVNQDARLGQRLRNQVDSIQAARNAIADLKQIADALIDGGDYSAFEVAFGVPTGKGETTYNLIFNADSALSASNVNQFVTWLG